MADMSYTWSPPAGRFRAPSGRFVTDQTILEHVDTLITAGGARLQTLVDRLTAGELTPATWETQAAQVLSALHLTSTSLASGGWAQMGAAEQAWTAQRLQSELGYLHDLATGYADGSVSAAQLTARTSMYAEAAGITFHAARQRERDAAGVAEARRVLGSGAHCDDCLGYAAQGWQPISEVVPPGTACACRSRCRCALQFRTARARVAVGA